MTALTDALEAAIAARQTLIDAQATFDAAAETLATANTDSENARYAVLALLPPDLITYEYTDSSSIQWGVSRDNNPSITLRPLNALP
ncbi:hypothetical protein FD724_07205 [Nostoc sp. C057]|uniref:hypothetical protein n=1 Tax=Nostoc sp. C057 TaxID=2576903 RepID=UPI0015C31AA6|nr:hypothetical protein [Nostoc sp. C057]QLE47816.1 hypothetical protein FD724_06635 [Nostoc sp. C057]QLE47923.1 hypothetical protein FD724_07205 [Nostoc sp. C057]